MKYVKHVGKTKNLGRRLIVITPKIPGKETHALIVDTDSLRDAYLNSLMDAVESPEAQASDDLGSALMRMPSPENNVTWLMNLHENNLMFPEPISNIIMLPSPSNPIELKYAIQLMEGKDYNEVMKEKETAENDTLHSLPEVMQSRDLADKEVIAMNLISEANRFKLEAERKLEEAYKLAPQLRASVEDVYEQVEQISTPENILEEIIEGRNVFSTEIEKNVSPEKVNEHLNTFKTDTKFNDDYFMQTLDIDEPETVEIVEKKVTPKRVTKRKTTRKTGRKV